jgi:hypothetical protein
LKGKGLRRKEEKIEKKCQGEKTTLRNIIVQANIAPNPSNPPCTAKRKDNEGFPGVANVLGRRCDDGWTKKNLDRCAKSRTVRPVIKDVVVEQCLVWKWKT